MREGAQPFCIAPGKRVSHRPNLSLQGFDDVVHPHGAAEWGLRFQFVLLFSE